jgi:hypothetical protein
MEVHAHTHTPRKKWTHYFWEFLMLFLAVFCGFLAEYQLEHIIEKERAKQFIVSIYEDLKNDTLRVNQLLVYNNEKIEALNNMYTCYDIVIKDLKSTSCMQALIIHSRSNRGFVSTDRTIRQLANAGGYRLLNKGDADSIIAYENLYKAYLDFQTTVFQQSQDNVRNTLNQLANFKMLAPDQFASTSFASDTAWGDFNEPLLFIEDRILVNRWFNELALYLRTTNSQQNILIQLKKKAVNLIQYYKAKHHFQ